ncbi:hypothetical protein ACWD7M_20805 [Streptomyces griseus]
MASIARRWWFPRLFAARTLSGSASKKARLEHGLEQNIRCAVLSGMRAPH